MAGPSSITYTIGRFVTVAGTHWQFRLFILAGDLSFGALLIRDIVAFGQEEHDLAAIVPDGREREIDDDHFFAAHLTVDFDFASDELTVSCAPDAIPLKVARLFGDSPPVGNL
jgi:hypothetical protein